jgi:hypothetical protein
MIILFIILVDGRKDAEDPKIHAGRTRSHNEKTLGEDTVSTFMATVGTGY